MDIPINATVQCTDGPGGRITRIVLNPVSKKVTDVVVHEPGLFGGDVIVPVEFIVESAQETVRLRLSRDKLAGMQSFLTTRIVYPATTFWGLSPGARTRKAASTGRPLWNMLSTERARTDRQLGVEGESGYQRVDVGLHTDDGSWSECNCRRGRLDDIPERDELNLGEWHYNRRKCPRAWDDQRNDHHGHAGHRATGWQRRIRGFLGGRGGSLPARRTDHVKADRSDPGELY